MLIPGDLSDESFARSLVHKAREALGGLDTLALVAGKQVAVEKIADLTTEQFTQNLRGERAGAFWITQEAIPVLPAGSSIVTTSSIQAYQPSPHLLDYASTKAAILNYSRGLAKQVAEKGIRVNVVAPGPIWTAQISGGQTQENSAVWPEDADETCRGSLLNWLECMSIWRSRESSYVTAEVHGVCGGEHLGWCCQSARGRYEYRLRVCPA